MGSIRTSHQFIAGLTYRNKQPSTLTFNITFTDMLTAKTMKKSHLWLAVKFKIKISKGWFGWRGRKGMNIKQYLLSAQIWHWFQRSFHGHLLKWWMLISSSINLCSIYMTARFGTTTWFFIYHKASTLLNNRNTLRCLLSLSWQVIVVSMMQAGTTQYQARCFSLWLICMYELC